MPDAISVVAGSAQTFTVLHATVQRFTLSGEADGWRQCVQVEPGRQEDNSIRLMALRPCDGNVFVTADLGPGRSPLVAVMGVR